MNKPVEEGVITDAKKRYSAGVLKYRQMGYWDADYVPKDAAPPTGLAPPGLDSDACDGLATDFGTDMTLVEPEPACESPAEKLTAPRK